MGVQNGLLLIDVLLRLSKAWLSFPANPLTKKLLGRLTGIGRQKKKSRKRHKYEAEVVPSVIAFTQLKEE